MTISQKTPSTTSSTGSDHIPAGKLAYYQKRQRNRIYEAVYRLFHERSLSKGVSQADIARRLRKRPEQISRWLSGPGNWTLDTVSDLLLAMGAELEFAPVALDSKPTVNYAHPLTLEKNNNQSTGKDPAPHGLDEAQQTAQAA